MKWIPFCVAAYLVAFAEVSIDRAIVAMIFCVISFFYALHFDNQIIKFLTFISAYLRDENNRRERNT